MQLDRRLKLLKKPPFFLYTLCCFLGTFGSGLSYIALSWLVLKANNNVSSVAILMLCFWAPTVFLGPLLGAVSDRYSRKWILILCNGTRGILMIAFGWYFYFHISANLIYVLMLLLGIAFSGYMPATMGLVREIVNPVDLLYANSAIDIAYEVGNVLGMGSAGLFMHWFGAASAVVINGVIFIISASLLGFIRTKPHPIMESSFNVLRDCRLGLHYLLENKSIMLVYSIQLLLMVAFMVAPVLLAPFSKDVLHASAMEFGEIDASLSLGVVFGGILVPWLAKRFGFFRSTLTLCAGLTLFLLGFLFNREILLAKVLYFCIGFTLSIWPLIVTEAQELTELDYQSRVQAVFNSLSGVLILLVYLFIDYGGHFASLTLLYAFMVSLGFAAVLLLIFSKKYFVEQH